MADPQSIIAERIGGLRERRLNYDIERADTQDALAAQREARAQAVAEKQMAIDALKLQQETQIAYDTADFLHHFQTVRHDDPQYEDKIAAMAAAYPMAAGDKNVQAVVGIRNTARKEYTDILKAGGAYEFEEGPARNKFQETFRKTRDFNQARAAAKAEDTQFKKVREALAQGYLTNDDFNVAPGQPITPLLNKDGKTINYNNALSLAAVRQGETTGKTATQEEKEIASAQAFILDYMRGKATNSTPDPVADQLYKLYSQRVLAHEKARTAQPTVAPQGAPAPAPAAPAAAAPAGKPKFVKQNGVTYTLQPDGTYK